NGYDPEPRICSELRARGTPPSWRGTRSTKSPNAAAKNFGRVGEEPLREKKFGDIHFSACRREPGRRTRSFDLDRKLLGFAEAPGARGAGPAARQAAQSRALLLHCQQS